MKSASRRFLVCFRQVELESGDLDGGDGVFEYAQVKSKEEEEEALGGPPKRSSRRFSKALKSALFENSLSKSFRSGSSRISVVTAVTAEKALNQSETINPNSRLSSGLFSSSCRNPTGVTPKPPPAMEVNRDETMTNSLCFNSGLCMFLVSLVLTVFWGRLFAIAFTLIWLCSFSRRSSRLLPPKTASKGQERVESWDYKKRVIMEGLLQRNHHHRLH
ncbi:hypothetical protein CK203_059377 [Vitis vinifera]|uniref:Uncharacterized protein n=1 Tax=Vitis vinifera TaxID=29760 RepID=A0A438GF52_VITVI|nr:hypothetical protein CK203_059377 [Vitis vinifera]